MCLVELIYEQINRSRSIENGKNTAETFSYKKADRLLKRAEYIYMSKHGITIKNQYFIAAFCACPRQTTRLGVTVTTRVGNAVKRNRIKRFAREFFRKNRNQLKGQWDINIIAKKQAAEITGEQAYSSLQNIFARASRCICS